MTRPPAERILARQLRADGWTLRQIADHIGIALATASEWVRDVDGPDDERGPDRTHRALVIWTSGRVQPCARCGLVLPLELFNRYRDGRQAWCRRCFVESAGDHRDAAYRRRQERVERARDFVRDHLTRTPCSDCAVHDPVVLEFDHVHTKRDWVSRLVSRGEIGRASCRERV